MSIEAKILPDVIIINGTIKIWKAIGLQPLSLKIDIKKFKYSPFSKNKNIEYAASMYSTESDIGSCRFSKCQRKENRGARSKRKRLSSLFRFFKNLYH